MTPRKEKALSALLTSRTRAEAAKAAGIGESTLRGYLRDDPEFQARYKEAFGELVQDATRQAQQAIAPALDALRKIVENSREQSQARVMAARSALEFALKLTEQLDLLGRIEALEAAAKEAKQ